MVVGWTVALLRYRVTAPTLLSMLADVAFVVVRSGLRFVPMVVGKLTTLRSGLRAAGPLLLML